MNIIEEYSREIQEISNMLDKLRNGRVLEISGVGTDGYLSTNVDRLEEEITQLLEKIQAGGKGKSRELKELKEKYKFIK